MRVGAKMAIVILVALVVGTAALFVAPRVGPAPRTVDGREEIDPQIHGYDLTGAAGGACALRVALVLFPPDDVVLRSIQATVYVTFDNATSGGTSVAYPWEGGLWWRFESQQVLATVPAPCNAKLAQVTVGFEAKTLLGSPRSFSETVRLLLPAP